MSVVERLAERIVGEVESSRESVLYTADFIESLVEGLMRYLGLRYGKIIRETILTETWKPVDVELVDYTVEYRGGDIYAEMWFTVTVHGPEGDTEGEVELRLTIGLGEEGLQVLDAEAEVDLELGE